jgi:hypothetical protein
VVDPSVTLVEGACVAAVEVAHALVEVRLRSLDHEVKVVPHEAANVRVPAVAALDAAQGVEKGTTVFVVEDDGSVVVASGDYVVHGTGLEMASGASHAPKVAARLAAR